MIRVHDQGSGLELGRGSWKRLGRALSVKKRSISIKGHRTSISLEDGFWEEFSAAAAKRQQSVASLVGEIDRARTTAGGEPIGLSSAIRLFVLAELKQVAAACKTID